MRVSLCLLLLMFSLTGIAQDKKDAAKRLQQANQKLAGEKAALEREKAQLAREKGELTKERDALKEDAEKLKGIGARNAREAKKLGEEAAKLRADLGAAAEREAALKGELATSAGNLQEARRNGEQLAKRLANQGETSKHWQARTDACEGKNVQLLDLNGELIERYRAKSCADSLAEADPFTGIGKVRLENLVDEYRERLRGARFKAADDLKEKAK